MNEGLYRAGPTAGGLPLPRARLGSFTAAVVVVSVLAALVPWMLLLGRGPAEGWMTFRNGGIGMWLLALLDFALPVALGIAGALVVRGKRVPAGLFFGVAVIPLFVSVFFAYLALRKVEGAIFNLGVDPTIVLRISAAGMSEALSLDQLGGFVTCGSALIGAVALGSAVASIDVVAATRSDGERPSAVFGAASLVAGAAWFVGTIIVTALRLRVVGPIAIWMVLVVGLVVPFAVFAARAAPVLRGWHDAVEARKASGALLVAGLAAMLAVFVFERALLARTASAVFDAVSSENVDPSQRAVILMELVVARKWSTVAYVIHGVLGTATFGLAVAGSIGRGRHPVSPSTVMAASVGVFVLAATFALGVARTRSLERAVAGVRGKGAPEGITLPRVDAKMDEGKSGSEGIVLKADGSSSDRTPSSVSCGRGTVMVYADRMATVEMLANRVSSPSCAVDFALAAAAEKDHAAEARLGDLAPLVRGDIATIGVSYDSSGPRYLPSSGYLTVRALEDEIIEYEGHRVKLPLGPGSPDLNAGRYELVRYVFRPTDTMGHVVRVIVAMKERFRAQIGSFGSSARLEIDWPPTPLPNVAAFPRGLRLGTPVVTGRLTPEVITRVFRQNQPRLVKCYETARLADPKIAGTVVVKLAIDRNGRVLTAHAETTTRDSEVGKCMARAFYDVPFPEPEAGIVTVRYPVELGP